MQEHNPNVSGQNLGRTLSNPLLERARFPGETFALPSGGMLYKKGELSPDVVNGEVMVYPMVTLDEVAMKTPDKLLNGTAIIEVFRRCIPQVLQPLELFAKDVDFLMVCLRKLSYGDEMQIAVKHNCEEAKEHSYMVDINKMVTNATRLNAQTIEELHTMTLPNGQVVRMHPPKYKRILSFYQAMNKSVGTPEQAADEILQTMVGLISSVDGIDNEQQIEEWIRSIPAGYVREITEMIPKITEWGVKFKTIIICKDCGTQFEQDVPMNPIDFFS